MIPAAFAYTHLELGAGAYGAVGPTREAVREVMNTWLDVSHGDKYAAVQPKKIEAHRLVHPTKYAVLEMTFDRVVDGFAARDRGKPPSRVIFYVNDISEDSAKEALRALVRYDTARDVDGKDYRRRPHVDIQVLVGDYTHPHFFSNHGIHSNFDSIHLKNPECSLFHDQVSVEKNGKINWTSSAARKVQVRGVLQFLASHSNSGLYFSAANPGYEIIPEDEVLTDLPDFYQNLGRGYPYYSPDGKIVDKSYSIAFTVPRAVEARPAAFVFDQPPPPLVVPPGQASDVYTGWVPAVAADSYLAQ